MSSAVLARGGGRESVARLRQTASASSAGRYRARSARLWFLGSGDYLTDVDPVDSDRVARGRICLNHLCGGASSLFRLEDDHSPAVAFVQADPGTGDEARGLTKSRSTLFVQNLACLLKVMDRGLGDYACMVAPSSLRQSGDPAPPATRRQVPHIDAPSLAGG